MSDASFIRGGVTDLARYASGSQTNVGLAMDGSLKVTTVLPRYYELARSGRIYTAQFGVVADAVASVTDIPTTGGHFCLYNGNATGLGGKSLVILGWGVASASGTIGIGAFVVGGVSGGAQAAALTTTAGNIIKSNSGSSRTTAATADSTATLTTQPAWGILGNVNTVSGVAIGYGAVDYSVEGMHIVPPTYVFALAVVSPTGTTPKFTASITFAEIESELA